MVADRTALALDAHRCRQTAIDRNRRAGDIASSRRYQKRHGCSHILRRSEAADGNLLLDFFAIRGVIRQHRRIDETGRDIVGGDAALGIFGAGNVGAAVTKFAAPFVMLAYGWEAVAQYWSLALAGVAIFAFATTQDDPETVRRRAAGVKTTSLFQSTEARSGN